MLYVALLRGINITGRRIKMDALRAAFEQLGYENCATFIASGNVIFETTAPKASLEAAIEAGIRKTFGWDSATFVRTKADLGKVVREHPFAGRKASSGKETLHVGFLKKAPPASAVAKLEATESDTDTIRVKGKELYWLIAGGMQDSKLGGGSFEKILGGPTTLRNITSVGRLLDKLEAQ